MKFQRRKGVSVIIATLLLIAISVAAGIVVYVFVNGLAGNLTSSGGTQTTERLQMQAFNFNVAGGGCTCSGSILQIFLVNSGSATTTISGVYYDGALVTLAAATQTYTALPTSPTILAFYTTAGATIADFQTTCNTTAGLVNEYCSTVAGTAATNNDGQLYNAGATGQIFFVFPASPNQPVSGTSHTVKVISTTGATNVFSVVAGRTA